MADHNNAKDAVTAWLNESEGFSLRIERLHEDAASGNDLVPWLVEAFRLGADRAAPTDNTALVAHIRRMQSYVREYLEPGPYVSKHGKIETFNEPHKHQSEGYAFYMRTQMQAALLHDLIHMLDGPEERAALASREAPPAAQEPVDVRECQTCQGFGWIKHALNKCPDCAIQPACQQEPVTDADLAAARAEIERLTKELEHMTAVKDIHQRKRHEHFERAEKAEAEAERDEAQIKASAYDLASRHLEAERNEARSMLADAGRDMRQRAAELAEDGYKCRTCRTVFLGAKGHDCSSPDWDGLLKEDLVSAILALPLKHADREGGS